jgi:hypothetical protein
MPAARENTFNYETATELPVRLPLEPSPEELAEVVVVIRTAESIGKAVVVQLTENDDEEEELVFYAIDRADV